MEKQLIISLSREYGSGGHHIAESLAETFGIRLYDHELLDHIAEDEGINLSALKKYDEMTKKPFFSRTVRGMSNSPEDALAAIQFDFLQKKAAEGESFVIVGRCAETALKAYPNLIKLFVMGDYDAKLERIKNVRGMNERDAIAAIKRHDHSRKQYHNHYSDGKWGDSRYYDVCINSSKLGVDETAEAIIEYVKRRLEKEK